jgi:hypothetical protein
LHHFTSTATRTSCADNENVLLEAQRIGFEIPYNRSQLTGFQDRRSTNQKGFRNDRVLTAKRLKTVANLVYLFKSQTYIQKAA